MTTIKSCQSSKTHHNISKTSNHRIDSNIEKQKCQGQGTVENFHVTTRLQLFSLSSPICIAFHLENACLCQTEAHVKIKTVWIKSKESSRIWFYDGWNDLQVQWGLLKQFETLDMRNMTWLYILSTNPDIRTIQHCVPWTIHSQCLLAGISSIQQQLHAPDSALSLRNALRATCATAPAFETCCFEIVFIPQVKDTFPAKCATTPSPAEPHQNKAYQTLHRHTNH